MAKVIYKGLAKKDDPIYTGKYVVSSLKKRIINKKEKKKGKVLSDTVVMEGQESLIPKYSQGSTTILLSKNIRNKLADKKDDAITELTEQEKLAIFKNRY